MEKQLWEACQEGRFSEGEELLKTHSDIDVNWTRNGSSCLQMACSEGHLALISLILGHSGVDVNQKDQDGWTPFFFACHFGHTEAMRLLLKDPRVLINEPDVEGRTPLTRAAFIGHIEPIRWMIASGRDLDLGQNGHEYNDAIRAAKRRRRTSVAALLGEFKKSPDQTRLTVRHQLGLGDLMAAEVFAVVVFFCDELLKLKPEKNGVTTRFLKMLQRLPMELQMIVCHRSVGSARNNVLSKDAEAAFRNLARSLH